MEAQSDQIRSDQIRWRAYHQSNKYSHHVLAHVSEDAPACTDYQVRSSNVVSNALRVGEACMQGRPTPALGLVIWSQVPAHPSTNITSYFNVASDVSLIP